MISAYSDGYFGMMRDIGIGYQIAKDQRIKEREALLHQGNNEAALIAWEEREQHFPFPFSRGQITAYNAWKESKANGLEVVESRDLPWEKDFHDYIETFRFLYKGIIIKHNKTEPTYTKTSLFLCEKRCFLWPGLRKEGNLFKLAGPGGLAFFHLTKKEVSKWPMKK